MHQSQQPYFHGLLPTERIFFMQTTAVGVGARYPKLLRHPWPQLQQLNNEQESNLNWLSFAKHRVAVLGRMRCSQGDDTQRQRLHWERMPWNVVSGRMHPSRPLPAGLEPAESTCEMVLRVGARRLTNKHVKTSRRRCAAPNHGVEGSLAIDHAIDT